MVAPAAPRHAEALARALRAPKADWRSLSAHEAISRAASAHAQSWTQTTERETRASGAVRLFGVAAVATAGVLAWVASASLEGMSQVGHAPRAQKVEVRNDI